MQFNEQEFNDIYDKEIREVNAQLDNEILFVLIGDVNAGKSSTVNQIMGEDVASVGAQPGETTAIKKYVYKDKIVFADTPGLDDINKSNSEETLKYYKEADVVLFFLNAAGTVLSDGEKKALQDVKKTNKEIILVLNKIDAADDIPGLVQYIRTNTNNEFKIVPISSRTGENMQQLRDAILDILQTKKKDLLFAKELKAKSAVANRWIIAASTSAGVIGAVPLPGADIVPLTGVQVGLMVRLATLYDKPISKERARELAIATLTGNIGKSIFRQAVKVVPGAGSAIGGGVAASLTLALGYGIKYAYENDIELNVEFLKNFASNFKDKNPNT